MGSGDYYHAYFSFVQRVFSQGNFSKRIWLDMISSYVIDTPAVQAGTPMAVKCLEKGQRAAGPFLTFPKIS
jgi:hypothetical protein